MRLARLVPLLTLVLHISVGQWASVRETTMVFPTYGFGDPNPVARMSNIYPYYRFDGYSLAPTDQPWKVIVLENPYIRVLVAPDMGGKILGAFEKKSGKDFIYFNRVVKFREIAMRGPWTSGGIEFNFGAIGHAPTTANPVDYAIDASGPEAKCIVGSWDLASRTYWTVEIVLPPTAAYFETRSTWTNRTELNTSLYHWMNAAADAREDLVFEYPGTAYIGHDGALFDYPVASDGNEINSYRNNVRGSNKSFHVLGAYTDFFGARYRTSRTGVIHWSPYTDKPGKKIWQWSQAREGAIWTDLLTDPERGNPQYVEIQNGLLFNQAANTSTYSPYKHRFFPPHAVESFSEAWFPFAGIGHIVDANMTGVLSVEGIARSEKQGANGAEGMSGNLTMGLSAVSSIDGELVVSLDGIEMSRKRVSLDPLESIEFVVDQTKKGNVEVNLGNKLLYYSTEDAEARKLLRPKLPNIDFDWESAYGLATLGTEHARQRRYAEAQTAFEQSLAVEPSYSPALVGLAELAYRSMEYERAIDYASQALANDTYDPAANFVFGIANRRLGRFYDAMDALGIAASQASYTTAASIELAEIAFIRGRQDELKRALGRIDLLGPHYSHVSRNLRMLSARSTDGSVGAHADGPLDQFFLSNRYVVDRTSANARAFQQSIRNELPHESYLEIAVHYTTLRLYDDARAVLDLAPDHPYVTYWKAYLLSLSGDRKKAKGLLTKALERPIDLVFPHRQEDLPMFLWAEQTQPHWKTKYFISLLLRNIGRIREAESTLRACAMEPDAAAFYLSRASILAATDPVQAEKDFRMALQLDKKQWRAPRMLAQFYSQRGRYAEALHVLTDARKQFPGSYIIQFEQAQSLLLNSRPTDAMDELERTTLLPFEGARIGREVWNRAAILSALNDIQQKKWDNALASIERAREWPERLGVGRPDVVDERIEDFLEAECRTALEDIRAAREIYTRIAQHPFTNTARDLLSSLALQKLGKDTEAAERIQRLAKTADTEAGYWGKAVFEVSSDVRMAFEKELQKRRQAGQWEMIEGDPGFVLVYEAMNVLP